MLSWFEALPTLIRRTRSFQNTTDAIGRAAAEAMQGPIQAAYKDTFQSIVLPVFERGCQSMFQQINDSFKQGTQECKAIHANLNECPFKTTISIQLYS